VSLESVPEREVGWLVKTQGSSHQVAGGHVCPLADEVA